MLPLDKLPKRLLKPLVTKQLKIKVPLGVDPSGVAVDIPEAMEAAKQRSFTDPAEYDLRLLIHLMRKQFSKLDPDAVGDPVEYVHQMRTGLDPRDKVEEILAGSILLTYGRLAHLSHAASEIADHFELLPIFSAAETASTSLRRQLQLLSRYRAGNSTQFESPHQTRKTATKLEMPTEQKKRKYTLSKKGLQARRAANRKNKPWNHSTGPRTAHGKLMTSFNNFTHGGSTKKLPPLPGVSK